MPSQTRFPARATPHDVVGSTGRQRRVGGRASPAAARRQGVRPMGSPPRDWLTPVRPGVPRGRTARVTSRGLRQMITVFGSTCSDVVENQ